MKRSGVLLTFALVCITTVAVGIVMMISSLYAGRKAIYQENEMHLQDLVWSLDHSLNQTLKIWQEGLNYLVESEECWEHEKELEEGRNTDAYRKILKESTLGASGIVSDILIRKDDTVLLTANKGREKEYKLRNDTNGDGILLCSDDSSIYLGMRATSHDGTLEYIVLIRAESFYDQVNEYSASQGNESILYEAESGLLMFKKNGLVYCKQMKTADTASSGERLKQILRNLGEEASSPGELDFTNEDGEKIRMRVIAITDNLSVNGIFTIAVAEKIEEIVWQINSMMGQSVGAALLLIAGTAGLAFTMLYNRRRRTKMIQQLEDMERKNKLTAEYLEQQKALAHHQRLEVVGTLTAGIAHEFNNLLTPIMGYSLMLLEKLPSDDEESYDFVLEIYNASQKAKSIVASLSNLTRKPKNEQKQSISPDRLVEKVRTLASSACPNNIKTMLELKAGDATVEGDETRLTQMLLNLVLNACQAMEKEGGILSVSTGVQNDRVWIKVADTGKGIPKELEQKIFEPFFTTKETGKGTGLGLAIVHNIVQDAGGTIKVENRPEGGCCFTVYLVRNDKLGDHYYSKANIEPPYLSDEI